MNIIVGYEPVKIYECPCNTEKVKETPEQA